MKKCRWSSSLKILVDIGKACAEYQNNALRNRPCKCLECDEIWSFCYAKKKNVPNELKGEFGFGDVWTWTAFDAETKLVPAWLVGDRTAETGYVFINDLASRLSRRAQLTTDGHRAYLDAVEGAFGSNINYAMLIKIYGKTQEEIRYSPPEVLDIEIKKLWATLTQNIFQRATLNAKI